MDEKASRRPFAPWKVSAFLFGERDPSLDPALMPKARKKKLTRIFIIVSVTAGVLIAVLLAIISQCTKAFTQPATRQTLCTTQVQRKEW